MPLSLALLLCFLSCVKKQKERVLFGALQPGFHQPLHLCLSYGWVYRSGMSSTRKWPVLWNCLERYAPLSGMYCTTSLGPGFARPLDTHTALARKYFYWDSWTPEA